MKKNYSVAAAVAFAVATALTSQAALTVVPTSGSLDGSPPGTLYNVMQTLLGDNTYNVNASANRVDDSVDQIWTGQSGGAVVSTLILEIAGNRNGNSFGIYKLGSAAVGDRVQAFSGPAGGVSTATVNVPSAWNGQFGFYLAFGSTTFFSQQGLNGGADNMVTLKNTGAQKTLTPSQAMINAGWTSGTPVTWDSGEYLLAWEDLVIGHGAEPDYQDMLVKVNAIPVPEPATLIAGALLLLPFGASTIRYFRKNRVA